MRRFQQETEQALNKQLDNLQKQRDDDAAMKERFARERISMEDAIRQLEGRCNALDGDVRLFRITLSNTIIENE